MATTWSESYAGRYAPSEFSMLLRKLNDPLLPGGKYGILALHGRAAVPGMWAANGLAWGNHSQNLADNHYLVLAPDAGGPATWGAQATAIDAITGAYNALIALGCNTKVGILAHSMGVLNGLIWMKQNPTLVSAFYGFAGVSDLDMARANALFTAEINAAYGGAGSYAANSVGHKVADEYPTWRDLAPIRLAHGTADPFVEPVQSLNFVNGVSAGSNQPQVSYKPVAGADHTSVFAGVTVDETRAFFDSGVVAVMARALLKTIVRDLEGNSVAGAKVVVAETITITPAITDLFLSKVGGAAQPFLVSDDRGYVTGWVTTPRDLALTVSDNAGTAYYPNTLPVILAPFDDFTVDPVPVYEDPAEEQGEDVAFAALVITVTNLGAEVTNIGDALADHLADTSDAHNASAISVAPFGTISATEVQAALEEIYDEASSGTPDLNTRYAAPWGDDANDGLSWGTPFLRAGTAYDDLGTEPGIIYYAENTIWDDAVSGQGMWLTWDADPLDPGWRRGINGREIIGWPQGYAAQNSRRNKARLLVGDASHKGIHWIGPKGIVLRNVHVAYPQQAFYAEEAGLASYEWALDNCDFQGGTYDLPTTEINGNDNMFWFDIDECSHRQDQASGGEVGKNICLKMTGCFEFNIRGGTINFGHCEIAPSVGVGGTASIRDISTQGSFVDQTDAPPWIITGGAGAVLLLEHLSVFDYVATSIDDHGTPGIDCRACNSDILVVGCPQIWGNAHTTVIGGGQAYTLDHYLPEAFGTVGATEGHLVGPQERAHRGFAPTQVVYANKAKSDPTTWSGATHGSYPTGGDATVAVVAGPHGLVTAGSLTYVGAGTDGRREWAGASITLAVGGFIAAAGWIKGFGGVGVRFTTGGFEMSPDLTGLLAGSGYFGFAGTAQLGDWTFVSGVARITAIGTNPCTVVGQATFPTNSTLVWDMPNLIYIPPGGDFKQAVYLTAAPDNAEAVGRATLLPLQDLFIPSGGVYGKENAADLPAPATDHGVMYYRDNGAGKTQLVVRFPTGAVQVIATQP